IGKKDTRHLPLALLTSVLRHQGLDEGVNFVNAPVLAKERGLSVLESRDDEDPIFQNAVSVRATCDGGETHSVTGTLHGRAPRIVRFDGLEIELEPKGSVLITRHDDQPGVVGLLGTLLGKHEVNIRRIELGPATETSTGDKRLATGVLALYQEPSRAVLEQVRKLAPVRDVRLVRL